VVKRGYLFLYMTPPAEEGHMNQPLRLVSSLLAAIALASAPRAAAFTDLTQGRALTAVDRTNPKSDRIGFNWTRDPALLAIPHSPLCPTETKLRIVTDAEVLPELTLDCSKWTISGAGFVYKDSVPTTGLRRVLRLRAGSLSVMVKGPGYSEDPIDGPVAFVETRVRIGATEYCGRWAQPPGKIRKNVAGTTRIAGPTAACQVQCGNGITEEGEECDDGNAASGDGCDVNCTVTACGNGIVTAGEACDDGNAASGDGCRADCTVEVCGDGIVDAGESCDDGNVAPGDCCSTSCAFEAAGSPCADDGNLCTDDACDGAGACQHPANTAPCNDGDGCTIADVCAGGTCGGTLRAPWLNEIDYDDFFGVLDDRDEFVEIAGPAGTDLGGYQLVHVEGGTRSDCLTPHVAPFPLVGEPHMIATIPPGTVLGDDTGTGIGFYVACFTNTSTNVVNLPACDDVLPAPRLDSNLLNGDLLNRDTIFDCADGLLLLDPNDDYVDAVSWEGIVPALGAYGPFFHVQPPYAIPRDEGWLVGVSIEKTSSTLERAQGASEWIDPSESAACVSQGAGPTPPPACPTLTRSPGAENSQQTLECGSPCAAFLDRPPALLD
jgi:cysteine-rich repeat protein